MLWVGTPLGLARYDGHRYRAFRARAGDPAALAHPYVNVGALAVAPDGAVWAGTKDGLCRLDPSRSRTRCIDPTPGQGSDVHALAVAPDGTVWAGTDGGVAVVSADAGRVLASATTPPAFAIHLADGVALVGTTEGLFSGPRPDRLRRDRGPLGSLYVTSFADTPGGLWIGTFGAGAFRATAPGRFVAVPSTLADARIIALDYDPADGQVWAGTWEQGALVADETRPTLQRPSPGTAPDEATTAATVRLGRSGRWFGTWGGLYRVPEPPPYTWIGADAGLGPGAVAGLSAAADGSLWVATDRGTLWSCALDDAGCTPATPPAPGISDLAADGDALWVATFGHGLWRARPGRPPTRVGPPDLFAYALARSRDSLWVATLRNGVLAAPLADAAALAPRLAPDRTGPVLAADGDARGLRAVATEEQGGCLVDGRRPRCAPPLSPSIALSVLATPEGAWVGATDGLWRLSPDAPPDLALSDSDLRRPDVSCLLTDDAGTLWAATGSGIIQLDPRSGRIRQSPGTTGLPPLAFDVGRCVRVGRRLAFGHRDGVLVFDPLGLPDPPHRVSVTDVQVDDRFRPLGAPLSLQPDDGGPTFFFAGPLDQPRGGPFAYRLVGLDSAWTAAADAVTFPKLPAGRYTFEVRAGDALAQVPVHVLAPVWRRPWALALWALLALGVATLAYRLRVRSLLRIERTRKRIADDLHDEMGSRLGGLALGLDVAAETLPERTAAEIGRRADEARDLLDDLRDTVWVVDGSDDSAEALADRLRTTAEALLPGAEVQVEIRGDASPPLTLAERRHLLSLGKEALHNASRHGHPKTVRITLSTEDDVELAVQDDGRGFDADTPSSNGHGLRSLQRRAGALGGSLDVVSQPGKGARVAVRFRPRARRGWRDRVSRLLLRSR